MNIRMILSIIAGYGALAGCDTKGVPATFANVCDAANHKKTVEIAGYFNNSGSAMCSRSKTDPTMRCPIAFVETPGTSGPMRAYIARGNDSSETENVDKKGLKIRDAKGEFVENTQKVKLTAEVMVIETPSAGGSKCVLRFVSKIEKL